MLMNQLFLKMRIIIERYRLWHSKSNMKLKNIISVQILLAIFAFSFIKVCTFGEHIFIFQKAPLTLILLVVILNTKILCY